MSEEQNLQDAQLETDSVADVSQDQSWDESQTLSQQLDDETEDDQQIDSSLDSSTTNYDQLNSHDEENFDFQSLDLKFVLDIPLQVTVELGRKRILIQDLLKLSHGAVIELTKQVSEPLDILVNQKLIARGEVVVVNDKFGVRITDIISPKERLQQIQ